MKKINKIQTRNIETLENALIQMGLCNLGAFEINSGDKNLDGYKSLILIGPNEPDFWFKFKNSYEYRYIDKDPLDQWSERKISDLAKTFDAKPFFPFKKRPVLPFYSWALRSGRMWVSPVNLLVHETRGLMVSFRGALALKHSLIEDSTRVKSNPSPCISCPAPCISSCPVGALTRNNYAVEKCQKYVKDSYASPCRQGCLVRQSCPVGQTFREKEQSSFHMQAFLR